MWSTHIKKNERERREKNEPLVCPYQLIKICSPFLGLFYVLWCRISFSPHFQCLVEYCIYKKHTKRYFNIRPAISLFGCWWLEEFIRGIFKLKEPVLANKTKRNINKTKPVRETLPVYNTITISKLIILLYDTGSGDERLTETNWFTFVITILHYAQSKPFNL